MWIVAAIKLEKVPPSELGVYLAMTVVALILFAIFVVAMTGRFGSTAQVGFTAVAITEVEPPKGETLGKVRVILSTGERDTYEIGPKIAQVLKAGEMGALDVRKGKVFAWYPEGLSEDEAMLLRLHSEKAVTD
ncbi:MAG: hypothetical protein KF812_04420 [Fimbriimonadaceae bacterium]|nr:hypothetical protein [Fimbriimonadaceae bacterium]